MCVRSVAAANMLIAGNSKLSHAYAGAQVKPDRKLSFAGQHQRAGTGIRGAHAALVAGRQGGHRHLCGLRLRAGAISCLLVHECILHLTQACAERCTISLSEHALRFMVQQ